jgi:hypothetical protein
MAEFDDSPEGCHSRQSRRIQLGGYEIRQSSNGALMRPSMRRECVDHVVVLDEGTFSLNGRAPRGSGRRRAARSFRAGLIIPMINSWQLGVATAKRRTADFDSDAEVRILPPQPASPVSAGSNSRVVIYSLLAIGLSAHFQTRARNRRSVFAYIFKVRRS